ncbi:MAG TPA: hypothetical protein VE130_09740 [Nitrososphaeraceae archaeon]|nr:hypothetical protein [Nitrososphaeraceae archaeon]
MKCLALSGLLGLFATMFGAVSDYHVFAQITPAPEKYGGQSSSSSPSDDSDSESPSSNDDGVTGSDSSESSSSSDDSDIESSEEEGTTSDSSATDRLMEQIINKVNQDFAAVGLPSFGR